MIFRRPIIVMALAFAATVALFIASIAAAQQSDKVARIGVLSGTNATDASNVRGMALLCKDLAERGWVEGRNFAFVFRYAGGRTDRALAIASELVALKPDVIIVSGNPMIMAAKRAAAGIPIVMINAGEPVRTGLVASIARPGGNVTGFTNFPESMSGKWLEILREIHPGARAVGVLFNPDAPPHFGSVRAIEEAARPVKMTVSTFRVRSPVDIDRAFADMAEQKIDVLIVLPHPVTVGHSKQIIRLANRGRLPAVYPFHQFAVLGGLLSYGQDSADLYRRTADYADRILRGAWPGDLPIQQPEKFDFVVNLKAARALGLTIPQSTLVRADEVIE